MLTDHVEGPPDGPTLPLEADEPPGGPAEGAEAAAGGACLQGDEPCGGSAEAAEAPPPVAPRKARVRTRAGMAVTPAVSVPAKALPRDERLRRLLDLYRQGRTVGDIAKALGVSRRTVPVWRRQLVEALKESGAIPPRALLGRFLVDFERMEAALWRRLDEAERSGEHTKLLEIIRELRGVKRETGLLLARIGLFTDVPLVRSEEAEDPNMRVARTMRRMAAQVLTIAYQGQAMPPDLPDPAAILAERDEPADPLTGLW